MNNEDKAGEHASQHKLQNKHFEPSQGSVTRSMSRKQDKVTNACRQRQGIDVLPVRELWTKKGTQKSSSPSERTDRKLSMETAALLSLAGISPHRRNRSSSYYRTTVEKEKEKKRWKWTGQRKPYA